MCVWGRQSKYYGAAGRCSVHLAAGTVLLSCVTLGRSAWWSSRVCLRGFEDVPIKQGQGASPSHESMAAAWPRPLVLLLLLLLTAAAAFPTTANTQALQCPRVHDIKKNSPALFSLDEQAARSVRFTFPAASSWEVHFTLGEGSAESFTPRIHMEIKKARPTAQLAQVKVTAEGGKKALLLNSRVDSSWLEGDGQATLFLGESTLSIAFLNGDSKFLQQLSDPELAGLDAVQVKGNLQVMECEGPGRVPDTTAPTTTVPTTTTVTTTVPTTTTVTTTVPTTTTVTTTSESTTTTAVADTSTITPVSAESTAFTNDDTYNATTSEDDLPPPCVADYEVAIACPTPSSDTVVAVGGSVQCVPVPRWAWACAGLAVVFFVFIVALIIYSVTLYKRSWRNGKSLQASGGFGMTAQDMHYYEMRNNNLMIGNTVPRIVTPRPSSLPGLTPSHSINRLSLSLSPSRSTTPFPPPPQNTDMEIITDHKEKSRSSKVSFAED